MKLMSLISVDNSMKIIPLTLLLSSVSFVAQAQSDDDMQAQIDALKHQIEALERRLAENQSSEAPADEAIEIKWEPAPSIKSADGRFEMNLRGRVLADAAWLSDGDGNIDVGATEFRAARIGIEGKAWHDIKYKFEIDFADNDVDVKDAYLEWDTRSNAKIKLGQF